MIEALNTNGGAVIAIATLGYDDLGAGIARVRRNTRWAPLLQPLAAGLALLGLFGLSRGDLTGLILVAGSAVVLGTNYSRRFNGLLMRRQLATLIDQPVTLTIDDQGLHYVSGPSTGSLAWSGVQTVVDDPQVLVITRDRWRSWAIIPKRAFSGREELQVFLSIVRSHLRSSAPR